MSSFMTDGDYLEVMGAILLSEQYRGGNPHEPAKLMEGMFLGSQRNAECWKTLTRLNITHVLNCAAYKGPRSYKGSPYEGLGIEYYEFPADDTDHYDISRHFPEAFRFIDKARQKKGNVLVHCALGINRSGAICLAYLMVRDKIPILKATQILKRKRRVVLSNTGFQKLLIRLARRRGLLDKPTDEIFEGYNLPSRVKDKGARERSKSCDTRAARSRMMEQEILWPDERTAFLNGAFDKLVVSNGDPLHRNGDVIENARYLTPVLRPGAHRLASSLSRFDLFPHFYY